MDVRRWHEEPVEQLSSSIGRQVLHTESITLARIVLVAGAHVPRHEHESEQIANVLEGRLRFTIGDEVQIVGAGESVSVPAWASHEVEALADSVVLDVFSPPRADWLRGEDAYLRG